MENHAELKTRKRLISNLKRLNIKHQSCLPLVRSYLQFDGANLLKAYERDWSAGFQMFMSHLSILLADLVDTSENNILSAIATRNYMSLLPTEVAILQGCYSENEYLEEADVTWLLQEFGSFTQSILNSPFERETVQNFWRYDYRNLFRAYLNLYAFEDGYVSIVVRELDCLTRSGLVPRRVLEKHQISVMMSLIGEAKSAHCVDFIAFENINNNAVVGLDCWNVQNDMIADDNVHRHFETLTKRELVVFDCT